jgi:two-component sensor histidine kinase
VLEDHRERVRKLLSGRIASFTSDVRCLRKDGAIVWVGLTMSLQRNEAGRGEFFIAILRDIGKRRAAEERQDFLLKELAHRMKNQLSVVQSLAAQTARNAASVEAFGQSFGSRLQGLAVAIDVLVARNWTSAPLETLLRAHAQAFLPTPERLVCDGPPVALAAEAAESLGLVIHELATNAVKYGAWSGPSGKVTVTWRPTPAEDGGGLTLEWVESGGPPVGPPRRKGFGSLLIERMAAQKLDAEVETDFAQEGFRWRVKLPATIIAPDDPG